MSTRQPLMANDIPLTVPLRTVMDPQQGRVQVQVAVTLQVEGNVLAGRSSHLVSLALG